MVNDLDYEGIEFPMSKKDFSKTEKKNKICIDVICYQKKLTQPVYISDQDFENCIDLLLISDENKLHYVSIKDYVQ